MWERSLLYKERRRFSFSLSSYGEDMHERFLIINLRSRGGGNFIIVEEAEALTGEDEEEAGYSLPGCKFSNPS